MATQALDPEKKEARLQTLALRYFNGFRQLLNWKLAAEMAKVAQDFYEGGE